MTTIDPYYRAHTDTHPEQRARLHVRPIVAVAAIAMPALLGGCAVVSIASTAASVAATVASTAIDVGVGAVKVTGKVIGKGVDLVTGPSATPTSSRQ